MIEQNFASISSFVYFWRWQLPTHDSTKSYQNLLVGVYGGQYIDGNIGINKADSFPQQSPISFIRSGDYVHTSGDIADHGNDGFYWESRVNSNIIANALRFGSTYLVPRVNRDKGYGFILRCLVR